MTNDGKDFGKMIGEKLSQAVKDAKAKTEKSLEESMADVPEDLNILPMPDSQEIHKDWIEWTWIVQPKSMKIRVNGVLYTHNTDFKKAGEYIVDIDLGDPDQDVKKKESNFTADVAKDIGKAVLSASNWINVWKQHFGELFVKMNTEMGGQISVTEAPE